MKQPPPKSKIFPRNLTAHADYLVRGNPVSSRPESGVDNCYPGLEIDQRNLDKSFFPGLYFEFHAEEGARLAEVRPNVSEVRGIQPSDAGAYLWAVLGRTAYDQDEAFPPALFMYGLNGLEAWRRVHDLLPERVVLLFGSQPGFGALPASLGVGALMNEVRESRTNMVERNEDGNLAYAVVVGDRARYLDEAGVIDTVAFEAGELTRTLCSPWQYDFRDCGCFYWAANKPDLVVASDGQPHANYARRTRSPAEPDEPSRFFARADDEMDYAEFLDDWNDLPVVLNDREQPNSPIARAANTATMTPQEVRAELRYLATVEHALCVEYLYAHYSLKAPAALPGNASGLTTTVHAAASLLLSIAIDEMRHLRWANEALHLLGESPELGRATEIGRELRQPFSLAPLDPTQLQWFIEVERVSQEDTGPIDGMYVALHRSIEEQPYNFPQPERLLHLLKLIIDEGHLHFERFEAVQHELRALSTDEYLRTLTSPAPGSSEAALQALTNQNYAVMLGSLEIAFSLGDRSGGLVLEQARRAMHNLHEAAHMLALRGVRTPFEVPDSIALPAEPSLHTMLAAVDRMEAPLNVAASRFSFTASEPSERVLAERQRNTNEELFSRMREVLRSEMGR